MTTTAKMSNMEIPNDIPVVKAENEKEQQQEEQESESLNCSCSKEEFSSNYEAMHADQVQRKKTSPRSVVSLLSNRSSDDAKQPLVKSNLDDDEHNSMDDTFPPQISRISSSVLLSDWIPPPASCVSEKLIDTEETSEIPHNGNGGTPKPALQDKADLVDANGIEPEMKLFETNDNDGDGISHTSVLTVPNCIPSYISIPDNANRQHPYYDDSTARAIDMDALDPVDDAKEDHSYPVDVFKHLDCESVGEKSSQMDRKNMTTGGDFIVLGIQTFGMNHVSPMEHVIHSTTPSTRPDLLQEKEERKNSTAEMGLPSDLIIQYAEGSQIQSQVCPKEEIQGTNNQHNPGESMTITIRNNKSTKPVAQKKFFHRSHIHYNPSQDVSNMVQQAYDNISQIETSGIFIQASLHGKLSAVDKNIIVPQNNDILNTEISTAKIQDVTPDYEKASCSTEATAIKETEDVHDIANIEIPLTIKQEVPSINEASMKNLKLVEEYQEIQTTEVANAKDNTEKAIVENSHNEKEIREGTLADDSEKCDLSESFTSEFAMENQKEACKAEILDTTIDSTLSEIPSITIEDSKMDISSAITIEDSKMDINSAIINVEDSKQALEIAEMKIEDWKESTIHEIPTSATEDLKEKTLKPKCTMEYSNKTLMSEETKVTLENSKEISLINIEESRDMCIPEIRNTIMEDLEEDLKAIDAEAILEEGLICRLEAEITTTTISGTQSKEIISITMTTEDPGGEINSTTITTKDSLGEINSTTMTTKDSMGDIILDETPSISVENTLKDINKGTMSDSPSQNTNLFTEESTFKNTQLGKESNLAQNCESKTQNDEQTYHSASSHNRDEWDQISFPKLLKQSHMHYNPSHDLISNFIEKSLNRLNSDSTCNSETYNHLHRPTAQGKDNVSATNGDSKCSWIQSTIHETFEKVMIQESNSGLVDWMCVSPLDTNTVQQGWNYVAHHVKEAVNNHMTCNKIATNIDLNDTTTAPNGGVCHENSKKGFIVTDEIPCSLSMDKLEVSMEKIGSLQLKGLTLQAFYDIIWGQPLYRNWLELMGMEDVVVQEWQDGTNNEQSYLEKSFLDSTMHGPIVGKCQQQRNVSYSFVRRTHLYQGSLKGIVRQCDYSYWNYNDNHFDDNDVNMNNSNQQNPSCIISQQIHMEGTPYGGDCVVWEVRWVIVSCGTMDSTDLKLTVGISMPHIPKDVIVPASICSDMKQDIITLQNKFLDIIQTTYCDIVAMSTSSSMNPALKLKPDREILE